MLRSVENIFKIREHLGYAADDPKNNYFLDTIGNDKAIFEHGFEYEPRIDAKYEPRF
jgi:hypothetical protein